MRALREQDFDRMAAHVVDEYLSGRAKLADAAATQARDAGLNPDQIERLTQSANTLTFLRLMADRKAEGAADLTHEFDPIDARQVIRIVIDETGVHIDPGPDARPEPPVDPEGLPDEMGALRRPPPEVTPPQAGAEPEPGREEEVTPRSKKQAELQILRGRKLASIFEDQLRQAEWAFDDAHQELAGRFGRLYNPVTFVSFEKDALAEHGDEVGVAVLNLLREGRRLPPLDTREVLLKTAALVGLHLSEDTPELRLFESLVKIARGAADLRRGLDLVRSRCR